MNTKVTKQEKGTKEPIFFVYFGGFVVFVVAWHGWIIGRTYLESARDCCLHDRMPMESPRAPAYVFLLLNAVLVTVSEILLKVGATATSEVRPPAWLAWTGVTTLGSGWAWIGILFYIGAFVVWLHVLRTVPLSIAFPIAAVTHVLIPLGSLVFLGESVPMLRWAGIALILSGVWLLAGAIARAEAAS